MSHPPSTSRINCFLGFGKTLVNSAPAGRGGLPLAVVALLGSYEEALSADVDEDKMGHMTQNGLMEENTRSGDLIYMAWE